jgi:DeoR/GlpR family transcriptional regulator of sugar metabolism
MDLTKRRDVMLLEQRQEEIVQLLMKEKSVKTSTLCGLFSASRETIRRDLEALEGQGMLKRIHGGAMRLDSSPGSVEPVQESTAVYTSFDQRRKEHSLSKEEVALEAAGYILEGQVIALDSGTTSLELARVVKSRFHRLTVVTNSLSIANELADAEGITLILTGGIYSPEEKACLSDMATLILSRINIDILFLTTCGISVNRGITYQRMEDLVVQDKFMEASDETIVIADSSKLGVNSLVRMCGIEQVSRIITDSSAAVEQIAAFEEAGIPVVVSRKR